MMKKLTGLVVLCALMVGAGCNMSRGGKLAAGIALTTLGIVITSQDGDDSCDGCEKELKGDLLVVLLGIPSLLVGAGMLISSFAMGGTPDPEVAPPQGMAPGEAAGVLPANMMQSSSEGDRELVLQIQLSARAGRCSAVTVMIRRLITENLELARWVASADAHVKRCLPAAAQPQR